MLQIVATIAQKQATIAQTNVQNQVKLNAEQLISK